MGVVQNVRRDIGVSNTPSLVRDVPLLSLSLSQTEVRPNPTSSSRAVQTDVLVAAEGSSPSVLIAARSKSIDRQKESRCNHTRHKDKSQLHVDEPVSKSDALASESERPNEDATTSDSRSDALDTGCRAMCTGESTVAEYNGVQTELKLHVYIFGQRSHKNSLTSEAKRVPPNDLDVTDGKLAPNKKKEQTKRNPSLSKEKSKTGMSRSKPKHKAKPHKDGSVEVPQQVIK